MRLCSLLNTLTISLDPTIVLADIEALLFIPLLSSIHNRPITSDAFHRVK